MCREELDRAIISLFKQGKKHLLFDAVPALGIELRTTENWVLLLTFGLVLQMVQVQYI
jgi:hypothetical protein